MQFKLPTGAGGQAAAIIKSSILSKINNLTIEGKIGKNPSFTVEQYVMYVWLENEQDYTVFFLVWDHINFHKPTVVYKSKVSND